MRRHAWSAVLVLLLGSAACERESRRYKELPASESRPGQIAVSALEPGGPTQRTPVLSPYQENAWGIGEGKRLYSAFNCNGCHAQGGGGIGPPLMDAAWIYGSGPEQIYSTIAQGRPNGMPAFGGKIPDEQIWQIARYVRSLSKGTPEQGPGGSGQSSPAGATQKRGQSQPAQAGGSR